MRSPCWRDRCLLALLLPPLLLTACTISKSSNCTVPQSCATQGFQCGAFVDPCGTRHDCGTCATGSCSRTDGTAGFCALVGPLPAAGNPDGHCLSTLPPEALPADTSTPTTVVGTGTAASCTHAALATAVAQGGVITFDCGADAVTIPVTATLDLPVDRSTVIDGGNRITLDGGFAVRILSWDHPNWQTNDNVLTLQHLVLANGKATGTKLLPVLPDPDCSQGYTDGQGGALFMRNGILRAVDVTFASNQAALIGPDTGGGAVYLLGSKPATISSCSFLGNRASNAGGLGALFATLNVYDSLFDGNDATGNGANDDNAAQCPYVNENGQHQVGSGGNGGALYSDGVAMDVTICGTQVRSNHAGAFGAAIFFTSNTSDVAQRGTLRIQDSLMFGNVQDRNVWQWRPGISTNANTPDPVNSDIR